MSTEFLDLLKKLKQHCPLFDDFSDAELKKILILSKVKKNEEKNQTIFFKGDEGDSMYLILKGEVIVYLASNINDNTTINTLSAGDIFGEMSLITHENRSANVMTSKPPVILLEISEKVLEDNYQIQGKIYKNFSKILAGRLKEKNREVNALKKQSGLF